MDFSARYIGPETSDLVVAQEVAPRRHLAVLAQLPVVKKRSLSSGNLAGRRDGAALTMLKPWQCEHF